jgi:chromosome segregation ATPase
MAKSFYTAVTWQPTSKTTNRYGTNLSEKIEAKPVSNEEVESLTNALKQAFSEIKLLKSRLEATEWESKMFAQSCEKYMEEAEKINLKHKMDLMSHHQESETKNKTLEERCKSLSAWAEQHRLSSEKHHRAVKQHEENIKKLEDTIKKRDVTIQSHKDQINQHKENIKSMEESQKKHEFSKQLKDKACSVLKTSSEILGLAADKTSEAKPEQLTMWLSEVCCAINGLERDIRESSDTI